MMNQVDYACLGEDETRRLFLREELELLLFNYRELGLLPKGSIETIERCVRSSYVRCTVCGLVL